MSWKRFSLTRRPNSELSEMKKLLLVAIALVLGFLGISQNELFPPDEVTGADDSAEVLAVAFDEERGGFQVEGSGVVIRILADDNDGGRHQRFILRLSSGQTLLIAHNIDLAPRVDGVAEGDTVRFFGEYEWNPQGGVLHWTHHDPQGRHPDGWLQHDGSTYQ